jgi:hypothetical protein
MKRSRLASCVLIALVSTILLPAQGPAQERERDAPRRPRDPRRHRPQRERRDSAESRRQRQADHHRPAEVKVWQLEHISVDRAMATLEQLAEAPEFGQPMERLPLAVNNESNTIVAVAPEDALDILDNILSGIDQPRPEAPGDARRGRHGTMRMLPMSPHGGHLSPRLGRMPPPAQGLRGPGGTMCPRCRQKMHSRDRDDDEDDEDDDRDERRGPGRHRDDDDEQGPARGRGRGRPHHNDD